MVSAFRMNLLTVGGYVIIFLLTCLTTAMLALFCSTIFSKTSTSLMATYTIILLMYVAPLAASFFGNEYFPQTKGAEIASAMTITSPFAAAFEIPIYVDDFDLDGATAWEPARKGEASIFGYPLKDLKHFGGYVLFTLALNASLFGLMIWMFNSRWRVSSSQ